MEDWAAVYRCLAATFLTAVHIQSTIYSPVDNSLFFTTQLFPFKRNGSDYDTLNM